ncbi:MAG TPA: histidine kinase dimerization/phospho-acceptor domain-containing protein [Nitrososphaeraceae archaeon]|nr:histidine kinase dimerization/phospho-acceptor domain-containing protein [Nitrososphaeraceae archaeon]
MNQESNSQELDQKILILNGVERILDFYISRYKNCKKNIVICNDYTGPITIKKTAPIWNENLKLDARGIQFRCLTDIRNENLEYCKEMLDELKHLEIRHMDGVKGNFTIHDNGEIFIIFVDKTGEPVNDAIFSTHKGMVEAHLFTFENLWSQATPAPIRIKELERGIQPEVLRTIRDPNEILETAYNLVKSAKEEILIIFHTANALLRQEKTGGLDLLIQSALKYRTRIRILVPIGNEIASTVHRLGKINGIQIRNIEHEMQTMMTILVADRMSSLVIELKDDTKDNSEQAIGLATYSNSRSTVLSYASIFETIWRQSKLREELTVRSIAQRDFINIAAHELRNPIQPILGLSDILQRSDTSSNSGSTEFKMTDQQKEMIAIIARNARRLERLAEDILDVTKIDGKTLKLNKEKFVLSEAIEEIVGDYAMDIRDSNKNIVISFSLA